MKSDTFFLLSKKTQVMVCYGCKIFVHVFTAFVPSVFMKRDYLKVLVAPVRAYLFFLETHTSLTIYT